MKTTQQHYKIFKDECRRLIDKFELNSFEFRFRWEDIDARAEITLDQVCTGIYTITLAKEINGDLTIDYLKRMAKHEMLHCLIGEFSECGFRRFVSRDEFDKLEEKIVNKLEKLICE